MAEIYGNLWEHNLARVVVVDVSDDYLLMQPPLPSDFYPVLKETYMPKYRLIDRLPAEELVAGYLYDWHESPENDQDVWYVGVVLETLANELISSTLSA
jgi:hypothetical protein